MNKLDRQIKENYRNMLKINKEYQDLVTDIVCYLRAKLNSIDAEEAINDVNVILLGAQSRGEDLNEVVGDYIHFCNEIIDAYRGNDKFYSLKSYIYDFGGMTIYMLMLFIIFDMISSFANVKPLNFQNILNMHYTISLAPFISCIISLVFSVCIVKYVCTQGTKSEKENKKEAIKSFVIIFIALTTLVLSSVLFKKFELYTFRNTSILIILATLFIFVYVANLVIKFIKLRRMRKISNLD